MTLNGKVKVTETKAKLLLLHRAISLQSFIKIREIFSGEEDGRRRKKKKKHSSNSIHHWMVNANDVLFIVV